MPSQTGGWIEFLPISLRLFIAKHDLLKPMQVVCWLCRLSKCVLTSTSYTSPIDVIDAMLALSLDSRSSSSLISRSSASSR